MLVPLALGGAATIVSFAVVSTLPRLLGARHATVKLTADALLVRMGWAFRAEIPRASIRRAARHRDRRP